MSQKDDQKELLKRCLYLQQEAVRLQKELEKAVSGQTAIQKVGLLAGKSSPDTRRAASSGGFAPASFGGQPALSPTDQPVLSTRDQPVLSPADQPVLSPASFAELQMLLVKVRVSMKTLQGIGQKSRAINEELQSLRDAVSSGGSGSEIAAAEKLQSLQVTSLLLAQTEAEADTLSAAYGELEAALKDAGKAVDEARSIQVRDALQRAAKLIGDAAVSLKSGEENLPLRLP